MLPGRRLELAGSLLLRRDHGWRAAGQGADASAAQQRVWAQGPPALGLSLVWPALRHLTWQHHKTPRRQPLCRCSQINASSLINLRGRPVKAAGTQGRGPAGRVTTANNAHMQVAGIVSQGLVSWWNTACADQRIPCTSPSTRPVAVRFRGLTGSRGPTHRPRAPRWLRRHPGFRWSCRPVCGGLGASASATGPPGPSSPVPAVLQGLAGSVPRGVRGAGAGPHPDSWAAEPIPSPGPQQPASLRTRLSRTWLPLLWRWFLPDFWGKVVPAHGGDATSRSKCRKGHQDTRAGSVVMLPRMQARAVLGAWALGPLRRAGGTA